MIKYKHISVVFNNDQHFIREYEDVYVSQNDTYLHISKDDTVEVIPMYNVLYIVKEGKI